MANKKFHFIMIKPSHYDDDGYVIQFYRSAMPSNTLAALHGLAEDCRQRNVLGDDVDMIFTAIDETNKRVRVKKLIRQIKRDGGLGLIGLIGVQSNQFPRAMDLARKFREAGIQVCIGGFHVSGCMAMLPELPTELRQALDIGVSLFAGEAEGRLEKVLKDALDGQLQPVYNYMPDLPDISDAVTPILDVKVVKRTAGAQASFDAGRGCPYLCSFCTIINVQGRKSRYRSADSIEKIIRNNYEQGIRRFFISDDNFARNQNWEEIFDRIIELRGTMGDDFNLVLQIDTACHRIPNFIDKAVRAGTKRVFIGLENINPESLKGAQKGQNRITDYRKMLLEWRKRHVITTAGYILGFPDDTPESIARDVEIIKRELPIDILEFFFLTPLPGSADHKRLLDQGVEMDPDLNKYDLAHVTTVHNKMSTEEWQQAYQAAWDAFYTHDHCVRLLERARASGILVGKIVGTITWFYGSILYEGVHPLESGLFRMKHRRDRRPGLPIENPLVFYPKYVSELVRKTWKLARLYYTYHPMRRELDSMPPPVLDDDVALKPVDDEELGELELYQVSDAARQAADKARRIAAGQVR